MELARGKGGAGHEFVKFVRGDVAADLSRFKSSGQVVGLVHSAEVSEECEGGRVGKVNRSILHNSVGVGKKKINKCALRGCNCPGQPLRNSSERGHRVKWAENEFCLSFPPPPLSRMKDSHQSVGWG